MTRFIDPLKDLGLALFDVQKPARYVGGEPDSAPSIEPDDRRLRIALCFPDLYEIGMSNNAIRILYALLNDRRDALVCERVFMPAPDFEALLAKSNVPLFTLESGIPLSACDVIAFSIGYELLATNILTVLERGGIPLESKERGEGCPIVIAGGPAVTNPLPFSRFIDALWIGEAEEGFAELMETMAAMKSEGASRKDMLRMVGSHQAIWMAASMKETLGLDPARKTVRAIYADFSRTVYLPAFPLPVLNPVQAHGVTEIMRGCPNGCRFCHAGYFYRPQRTRPTALILREVEALIVEKGYREITLSSLSSGDYPDISGLFELLNMQWASLRASFQLPSLKVETFTLSLLEKISEVRKSGLTFAVETPLESWQCAINKKVPFEKIAEILRLARARGFRSAKFYFMIGLPVPERGMREAEEIVKYIRRIAALEKISIHVNVSTFVPKPHTPFERERQISEEEAVAYIGYIRRELKSYKNIAITYHPPFLSTLEGIFSRGDERVGDIILNAYKRGARLDAWQEYFDRELWRGVLSDFNQVYGEGAWGGILEGGWTSNVPWQGISMKISRAWMEREKEKAKSEVLSLKCMTNCNDLCGVCDSKLAIVSNTILNKVKTMKIIGSAVATPYPQGVKKWPLFRSKSGESKKVEIRLVGTFSKENKAILYPLHSVSNAFSKALLRAGLPVMFSKGFNPQPKLEFVPPLPLGVSGKKEVFLAWLEFDPEQSLSELSIRNIGEMPLIVKKIIDFASAYETSDIQFITDSAIAEINSKLPQGLFISRLSLSNPNMRGTATIGKVFSASEWEYVFGCDADFSRAKSILMEAGDHVLSFVANSESRSIRMVELVKQPGVEADARLSSMQLLKSALSDGQKDHICAWMEKMRATRTACLARDQKTGALTWLQDIL